MRKGVACGKKVLVGKQNILKQKMCNVEDFTGTAIGLLKFKPFIF
jgi:hypothetical protein